MCRILNFLVQKSFRSNLGVENLYGHYSSYCTINVALGCFFHLDSTVDANVPHTHENRLFCSVVFAGTMHASCMSLCPHHIGH